MSVDPRNGRAYEYSPEQTLPDEIAARTPTPAAVSSQYVTGPSGRRVNRQVGNPALGIETPQNPDGSDFGPLYIDPKYDQWLIDNIIEPDLTIDWGNRSLIDVDGNVVGHLPEGAPPVE